MSSRALNNQRILRLLSAGARVPLLNFDHHLCHAASAFYGSTFDHALILTLDEQGDGHSGMVATGERGQIRVEHRIPFPHSLAWIYSQITELRGFRPREHEHKTQWLSLTSEPAFLELFLRMMRRSPGPYPRLDARYFQRSFAGHLAFSAQFHREVGISGLAGTSIEDKTRAALASSLQRACEVIVVDLLESLRQRYHIENLCLAGGLFLNPLLVAAIEERSGFENIFV